jgi:hypothetical protein
MKIQKNILLVALLVISVAFAAAAAGDFAWTRDFNIKAEANLTDFRARMAARFKIGDAEINVVLDTVKKAADAYIVFRLGEIAKRPTADVLEKYKANKGKGWGVIAQSLGIKPGSKEFHALKNGSDLYDGTGKGKGKGEGKGKGGEKGKGKGNN